MSKIIAGFEEGELSQSASGMSNKMIKKPQFISGLDLAERFYTVAVKPILERHCSDLKYSAALIGSGSEVLGFDDEMSSDHHWGPRLMIFLKEEDASLHAGKLTDVLSKALPRTFYDYPTNWSIPNPDSKNVQSLDYKTEGPINHRAEILSLRSYFLQYLGFDIYDELTAADWLTLPEQKLRTITAGRVFHDEVGLEEMRAKFKYYPKDIWLYLLASCWNRIEQEEHLMGRAGINGDELGSAIIAARLVRDSMRLLFLMERQYAPYGKWLGVAFNQLPSSRTIKTHLQGTLVASSWKEREDHLVNVYEFLASEHNKLGVTDQLPIKVSNFFDRPFRVISKGLFSKALKDAIREPQVARIAAKGLIGNIDLLSDNTDLLSDSKWRLSIRQFYEVEIITT